MDSFLDLAEHRSPLALQSDIAAELRLAEISAYQRTSELARHKRLLRVIGDSLAFTLLHEHIIRTLARHPGLSSSLTGQRDDFAFTMDVAQVLVESGYVPILCDLTNVLRVGDIVAIGSEHVLILECKNTAPPAHLPLTGRLARQRAGGSDAAEYLRSSRIREPSGAREAIRFHLPQPQWDADLSTFLAQLASLASGTTPMLATHLDLLRQPSWMCPTPLVFPLPPWVRHALFEARAIMIRLIDLDRLATTGRTASGTPAKLGSRHSADKAQLTVTIGTQSIELGPWLMEILMHTPTAVTDLQHALLSQADIFAAISPDDKADSHDENEGCPSDAEVPSGHSHPYLADGDDVTYGTVYRSPDGTTAYRPISPP